MQAPTRYPLPASGCIPLRRVLESNCDDSLIGIRATIHNGARVGAGSIVAAGAVVTPGMIVPAESLVIGVPGKVVRPINEADRERIQRTAEHYVAYAKAYQAAYVKP